MKYCLHLSVFELSVVSFASWYQIIIRITKIIVYNSCCSSLQVLLFFLSKGLILVTL